MGQSIFQYDITSGVDAGYNAETSTDPKNNITKKIFDKAGRLKQVISGGTTIYNYYTTGARQSVVYPDGSKEEYTYYKDGLNKTLINKCYNN